MTNTLNQYLISFPNTVCTKPSPSLLHINTMNILLNSGTLPKLTTKQEGCGSPFHLAQQKERLVLYLSEKPLGKTALLPQKIMLIHLPNLLLNNFSRRLGVVDQLKQLTLLKRVVFILYCLANKSKMKETHLNAEAKVIPTTTFNVNNRTLNQNQPEGPSFTPYMLVICAANRTEEFIASKSTLQTRGSVTEAEADLGKTNPKDSLPPQQGTDERTIHYSFDNFFAWTNPIVLVEKITSGGDGLETTHTETKTKKESTTEHLFGTDTKEITQSFNDDEEIKWADLTELVQETGAGSMDLESLEDDNPLQVSSEDEADLNKETKDTSVPQTSPPSPRHGCYCNGYVYICHFLSILKAGDTSFPSACQADPHPVKGGRT
ncbi:hypothetical protein Tco_0618814 [Tanacetum coccineum]